MPSNMQFFSTVINILNQTQCDQKTNSSKMTLYKHHCVNVLFSEHIFYSQVNCFTHLMI